MASCKGIQNRLTSLLPTMLKEYKAVPTLFVLIWQPQAYDKLNVHVVEKETKNQKYINSYHLHLYWLPRLLLWLVEWHLRNNRGYFKSVLK